MPDAVKVISVQCNHCASPLDVDESTRFVTCIHCGSKLEIKRTGSAYFTSVLTRIDQATQSMAEDLGAIRQQNELERIDREWDMSRRQYAVHDPHGNTYYPGGSANTIGSIIGIVFGILWTILACAITGLAPDMAPFNIAKVIFPLFGVVFVIIGIVTLTKSSTAASDYQSARQAYDARRATAQRQMDAPPEKREDQP